jgi:hypothetical protein
LAVIGNWISIGLSSSNLILSKGKVVGTPASLVLVT